MQFHCLKIIHMQFLIMFHTDNIPPRISGNTIFQVNLGVLSTFYLKVEDESDNFTFTVEGGVPEDSSLEEVDDGEFVFLWNLQRVSTKPLLFVANDSSGASSVFAPRVEICACENGGICTKDNNLLLITGSATNVFVKECLCNEGIFYTFILSLC